MAGPVRGATISELRNNGNASSASSHHENEMRRIAHSIALRFRNDDKFSGKLGEDLNEAINLYLDAANDYELNQEQRLKYFHTIFEGEARRFYRLKVSKRVPTFSEACVKMRTEFKRITRQNRVRKYLQGLRLTAVMRERSCSVTEALEELRETITKFSQQGPRNHRSEEDKVEYLYRAVVGHEWAGNSLSQAIASEPADSQQMFNDLDSAWLQKQEETEGRKRDGIPQARYRMEQGSRLPGLYYEGQGFYGKPRKFNSKSSVPRGYRPTSNFQPNTSRRMNENNPGQNGLDKFGKTRKCHNCGSKDHFIRDCNVKRRNNATNVANMLRQNPNGAKQILYDLCLQTEDAFCNKEDHEAFFEEEEGKEEDGRMRSGMVRPYIIFRKWDRLGVCSARRLSIDCREKLLKALRASTETRTKFGSRPCRFINIRQSCTMASILDGTPLASCSGARRSRVSSTAAGSRTFFTRRRNAWPTAIGRIFPGRGWRGIKVEAERRGAVSSGMSPRARRWERRVRTDRPVMLASGLTEVRASNCTMRGESRS